MSPGTQASALDLWSRYLALGGRPAIDRSHTGEHAATSGDYALNELYHERLGVADDRSRLLRYCHPRTLEDSGKVNLLGGR